MVKFCQRLRLLVRLPFQATAFGNVPNVALYDLALIHLVDVADKFDIDPLSLLGFERQIFVANIPLRLQRTESGSALCLISEETDLPEFLADEFFLGIAQKLFDERIGIEDFPGVGIEDEDGILGGFEEPAIARLRNLQVVRRLLALGDIANVGLDDRLAVFRVKVGYHFDFTALALFGLERQIVVADELFLSQFSKRGLASLFVLEQADFEQLLTDHLFARVTEQLRYEGVCVGDLACVGIENQYSILGGFKETAVTSL
jgi:hypothetical protein